MATVERYVSTTYQPDREYVDGRLVERNVGFDDHSGFLTALAAYLVSRQKDWHTRVRVAQRVKVSTTRIRVPDILVILNPGPPEPIVTQPPFLCVEVVAQEDKAGEFLDTLHDYFAFGVKYIWTIHPRSRRAWVYTSYKGIRVTDGIVRTADPEFLVPLDDVYDLIS